MGRLIERPGLFIQEGIAAELWVSQLWHEINDSFKWRDGILYTLCAAYAVVAAVTLMQIIRIHLRVPEYGWTAQKVFHLMNLIVGVLRAVIFGFHKYLFALKPRGFVVHVLLGLPGMLFLSTYTLLVLFWAQIYHQARSSPSTGSLRPIYYIINGAIYFIQVCIWISIWIDDNSAVEGIAKLFIVFMSISAAMGFLIYGGKLFLLLRRLSLTESQDNTKMLREVCCVTVICVTSFFIRCFVVVDDDSLDMMNHPILNIFYYMLVEILPSALVFFILRELPPKKKLSGYHPLPCGA